MDSFRRYYKSLNRQAEGECEHSEVDKIELLMQQAKIGVNDRKVVAEALIEAEMKGCPAAAIELPDGKLVAGKTSALLGASAAVILNAVKELAGIDHSVNLISPDVIEPVQKLKTQYLGSKNPRLHSDEILIALSMCAAHDPQCQKALETLHMLRGCQAHSTVMLSSADKKTFSKLGMNLTQEPIRESNKIYG